MAVQFLELTAAATGVVAVWPSFAQFGGSGFQIASDTVSYPRELLDFLPQQGFMSKEVIRFRARGMFWRNTCSVNMRGYFSNNNHRLIARPQSSRKVPLNRYIKSLSFYEGVGSDNLTSGLLTVHLKAMDTAVGSPQDPRVAFWVSGRFDPVGPGDETYEFRLLVDTTGQVRADNIKSTDRLFIHNDVQQNRVEVVLYQYA